MQYGDSGQADYVAAVICGKSIDIGSLLTSAQVSLVGARMLAMLEVEVLKPELAGQAGPYMH
jgi:hypothetical protein